MSLSKNDFLITGLPKLDLVFDLLKWRAEPNDSSLAEWRNVLIANMCSTNHKAMFGCWKKAMALVKVQRLLKDP